MYDSLELLEEKSQSSSNCEAVNNFAFFIILCLNYNMSNPELDLPEPELMFSELLKTHLSYGVTDCPLNMRGLDQSLPITGPDSAYGNLRHMWNDARKPTSENDPNRSLRELARFSLSFYDMAVEIDWIIKGMPDCVKNQFKISDNIAKRATSVSETRPNPFSPDPSNRVHETLQQPFKRTMFHEGAVFYQIAVNLSSKGVLDNLRATTAKMLGMGRNAAACYLLAKDLRENPK